MSDVVLYDYWRSSASYRLRIALNLAKISYRAIWWPKIKNQTAIWRAIRKDWCPCLR